MGKLLRSWRERALLTQDQLAARAGLNTRTVRRLEAGQLRRPRGTSVRALAGALNLDDTELSILARAASADPKSSPPRRTTPRQLPADVPAFVGRARELAVLGEVGEVDDTAAGVIAAIDGMAGVGKTALAVHAAHQLASHFPDGDLFVDLHGYSQGMAAADPADALARMLGVLGVTGESIPPHLDDRAALYRSVLADRRMLIVLDNAADEEQVRPLLPGAGGCLVLITSRRRLVGLDAVRTVSVDVLPLADAIALFSDTAGEGRVAGVPREVLAEVVRRCGLLPLAIRLAAARLKAHPAWSVEHLLERLEEHQRLLSELQAGERSVTAALDMSYRELSADERRAYRVLGLHTGVDITPDAAVALLATTAERALVLLDRLQEVHLLQEPTAGRYRFHDLIRIHATAKAIDEDAESDRRAALVRLLDHYSQAASAAMDRLYPYEADMRPRLSSGEAPVPTMPDAAAWLEAELYNLLAAAQLAVEHGFPEHIRHLSATLDRCLLNSGRHVEAETLHTRALSAARAAADRIGEVEALIALGEIHRVKGQYDAALKGNSSALDIARAIGHRAGELRALNGLGFAHLGRDEFEQAADYVALALAIARSIGHLSGELDALATAGNVHRLMGHYNQGTEYLVRALTIARSIGHRIAESRALIGLGFIDVRRGELRSAVDHLRRALYLARDAGHRIIELRSLTGLGYLHRIQGRYDQAGTCYRQIVDLAREISSRNWEFEGVHGMGRLQHDSGRYDQALDSHRQALQLALDLGHPSDEARVHDALALAHAALGQHDQARHHWSKALTILTTLGIDRMDEEGVDIESFLTHLARLSPVNSRSAAGLLNAAEAGARDADDRR
ncbi:ATP-binding protein [Nonomuraea guangzhouensis]|uniref:ATP-binding protein n=1 Tax=Nonomuraea guangzhouensis TaxID=1291555 RepID=A0ABW4GR84_9ACTN|nr:helix-turn-helix domain-containing protein [Nonomuraea guangzhouensis]